MKNQITIENFFNELKASDLQSLVNVLDAYKKNCQNEEIENVGFNYNSGYVYFALCNGVQIASCFGQSVDYIVYDFETGEESFFDTYDEAMESLETKI